MSQSAYIDPVTSFASQQVTTLADNVTQLNLTVAYSSDLEPDANTICLWANQGTGPAWPLFDERGATTRCGVRIDEDDNVAEANSLSLNNNTTNPNGDSPSTLWYKGSEKNLYFGASAVCPIGSVIAFAGSSAPTGWLLCDGSSLLRAGTYANLFAVIGVTYGNVDGTHFTLPTLSSRVIIGTGQGAYKSAGIANTNGAPLQEYNLGDYGGYEYPSGLPVSGSVETTDEPAGAVLTTTSSNFYTDASNINAFYASNNDGGNIQPYLSLNYIIKY